MFEVQRKPYNDYTSYFKQFFSGRVQKIAVNAGFTCPNRDGSKGKGGCSYCNNRSFNPYYCHTPKSISEQLQEGIAFFGKKYKTQRYLAYFQAYSNTYAPVSFLRKIYKEALEQNGVEGLVIATRPDCVSKAVFQLLEELAKHHHIVLEFGVETCSDSTLQRINRGHSFADTRRALQQAQDRGLHVGIHYIMGLPGDTRSDNLTHASILSELPFETLKLHQLQIIKGTALAKQYQENPENFSLFSLEEYIDFAVSFAERLRPDIVIERFTGESPPNLLIAPHWGGLKNYAVTDKIIKRFQERNTRQGQLYTPHTPFSVAL